MPASDTPVVAARRKRLREWIRDHHQGQRKLFLEAARAKGYKLDPSEISNLQTGNKSFGEKKAAEIEEAAGMPQGYLVYPLSSRVESRVELSYPVDTDDERPIGLAIARLENDSDAIQFVLGAMFSTMLKHRPAEAAELVRALDHVPEKFRDRGLILGLQKALGAGVRKAKERVDA